MGKSGPLDRVLGCRHVERRAVVNGSKCRIMEFDMRDFMGQCVQRYRDLSGDPNLPLRKVDTPFLSKSVD